MIDRVFFLAPSQPARQWKAPCSGRAGRVGSIAALLVGVTGCAAATAPAVSPGLVSPAVAGARTVGLDAAGAAGSILVSNAADGTLDVFSPRGKREKTIGGFSASGGIAAIPAGGLYDAISAASTILRYASDYATVTATLSDPGEYPVSVAYDAQTGSVGVANILSTTGGSGSVSMFARNERKACVTVGNRAWSRVYFVGFDAAGNLYVDGSSTSGATLVGVVSGGCAATTIQTLATANRLGFPGGIAVTPSGNIAIGDGLAQTIDTYGPPVKGSLGMPIATTPVGGSGPIAFSASGTTVWVASSANVLEYAYPAGGSPLVTISGVGPAGIAVLPVARP